MKTNISHLAILLAVMAATPAWAQSNGSGLINLAGNRMLSESNIRFIARAEEPMQTQGVPSGGCDTCGTCNMGSCDDCVAPWAHRTGIFGEALYLNAQDVEVPYAVQINGPITGTPPATPIQTSPVQLTDPDYQTGVRGGFTYAMCDDASIVLTYSHFEADNDRSYIIANPNVAAVLRNLASHPLVFNAASDGLSATAHYEINFDLADADYRAVVACGDLWALNVVLGGRYAHLEQAFSTTHTETISETVDTRIEFDGAGGRIGFDGEKHAACSGLFIYGKTIASFASGNFRATYNESQTTAPNIVDTGWTAGRVVTMLDLEMGAGWQSCCGTYRMTAGYMLSGWYNVVKSDDWIRAVQTNYYGDLGSNISFDGLTAKVEVRW